ncbi:MAG: hypothetical protein M1817_005402 [Caeruleum heppii]|nr:MAG: hypothetical protein M1817_005402 [Caeruleum heppii]
MVGIGLADWLALWHSYRIPLLLACFAGLIVVRTLLHVRHSRDPYPWSNPSASPTLPSAFREKISGPTTTAIPRLELSEKGKESTAEKEPLLTKAHPQQPRRRTSPKRVTGQKHVRPSVDRNGSLGADRLDVRVLVFFSSLTGTTQKSAEDFHRDLSESLHALGTASTTFSSQLRDISDIDYDDYFTSPPKPSSVEDNTRFFYLILLPSYNIDTMTNTFLEHLRETHHDFRIDTAPLSALLGYSVFGFGDKEGWPIEEEGFCSQAREVDRWMAKLTGRRRAFPLGMGDVKSDSAERLAEWRAGVEEAMRDISAGGGLGEGVTGSGDPLESDEEQEEEDDHNGSQSAAPRQRRRSRTSKINDLEDIGGIARKSLQDNNSPTDPNSLAIDFTTPASSTRPSAPPALPKEMVPKSSPTYTALTKQGYTIVGSHSGVKICRWTKSALRGRGSCYKFSFYGIQSHCCMETTPALSCSNKCVFCWRHGTNPVGTTWRWQVDDPDLIFRGAKAGHYQKIKMLKGVPGVRADRFAEAMRIRHCALSLVGEPIFYPHINRLLALLHTERISSFLVCNAQHPDQLAALHRVTQLYVSIDAADKESLRRIDRPLHRDYWERFQRCLDILREKRHRHRTVFRLTLVKGFNVDGATTVSNYADLIARALPCFVEIKGVTYCGTSTSAAAGLTMQNVPFYDEIRTFVTSLNDNLLSRGLDYGIAAEHAHSCCALIASGRFRNKQTGRWHTLIDYGRFFELLEEGRDEFGPEDYVGEETPEWAAWGRGGFDPRDVRVRRKGKAARALREGEKNGVEGEVAS